LFRRAWGGKERGGTSSAKSRREGGGSCQLKAQKGKRADPPRGSLEERLEKGGLKKEKRSKSINYAVGGEKKTIRLRRSKRRASVRWSHRER